VCDGGFFRGRDAAVVGGGNTALEDALYLSGLCRQVTLIHRRDTFRGSKRLEDALRAAPNVVFRLDSVPEVIEGGSAVAAVTVRDVKTGQRDRLPVSAVFVAVGTLPENGLLRGLVPLDEEGRVPAGADGRTDIPGVFVAGDLRRKALYQIVTACADGAAAASAAAADLQTQ
jgi:thioredoxin reductase (NADPH)